MRLPFKFTINTSKKILFYDNGEISLLKDGNGVYFGGTAHPDYGYIVLARNNFDGTGGGNVFGCNLLEFFDKNFTYFGGGNIPFVDDGHQIFYRNDIIYLVNTGRNVISTLQKSGEVGYIQLYNEIGIDHHHINSINFHDNKWYICQHRMKDKDDGGVAIFDDNWKFIEYINIGKHAHNCFVYDGYLWSCDSDNGQIVRVDLVTKETLQYSIAHKLMTRGILIKDGFLLVGLSEYDTRENRHGNKTGKIAVYQYPEMMYIGEIVLDDVGQVNDLVFI